MTTKLGMNEVFCLGYGMVNSIDDVGTGNANDVAIHKLSTMGYVLGAALGSLQSSSSGYGSQWNKSLDRIDYLFQVMQAMGVTRFRDAICVPRDFFRLESTPGTLPDLNTCDWSALDRIVANGRA